jgi:hypothetical protein
MVTDRSATATIKGYFFQFDQTIIRLLAATKNGSVTVEGVEDIDLEDQGGNSFIQCKYYEGTEYNHSVIKEAVIHMLRHFHAAGCPSNQALKYRLYGHYKSGQHKLSLPLTEAFVKANFLTYKRDKLEHKVHDELSITSSQFADFKSLLDIDLNAPSYDDQQKKIVKLLGQEIPECSAADAEIFYYPNSINVIQSLAVERNKAKRRITKTEFLKRINRKETLFSGWLQQKFGADYYARLIRRKFFRFATTKVPKATRIFVIDMTGEYDAANAAAMLARLGEFFSHKDHVRTTAEDRFCPYVLLRGLTTAELIELKDTLWKQRVRFNDGYPFQGADFSVHALIANPTKENLWRIKFIPAEDQLLPLASAISGSVIEVYDLYKSAPLNDALISTGAARHAIKTNSSYFIQEVMKA